MKNKVIFALAFLIPVVIVRYLSHTYLEGIDLGPILVTIAFILILKDKFSLIMFKRFNPLPFIVIIAISYVLIFLLFEIQDYFELTDISIKSTEQILFFCIMAIIIGLIEETAWRGYLFSKFKDLTWFQITIIINLVWAFWHIPSLFKTLEGSLWISFPIFIISCFELGIIMQYLRIKADSVIPCILFHALFIVPFLIFEMQTKTLYLGSFPSIILLLLFLPITIYCYRVGQRIHDTKTTRHNNFI